MDSNAQKSRATSKEPERLLSLAVRISRDGRAGDERAESRRKVRVSDKATQTTFDDGRVVDTALDASERGLTKRRRGRKRGGKRRRGRNRYRPSQQTDQKGSIEDRRGRERDETPQRAQKRSREKMEGDRSEAEKPKQGERGRGKNDGARSEEEKKREEESAKREGQDESRRVKVYTKRRRRPVLCDECVTTRGLNECGACLGLICDDCVRVCAICDTRVCEKHLKECTDCLNLYCPEHESDLVDDFREEGEIAEDEEEKEDGKKNTTDEKRRGRCGCTD